MMRVFVYDQESLVRERLERIVSESGHEVIAHRGEALLPAVLKYRPHILLINQNTPNFGELCQTFIQSATYLPAIIAFGTKDDCTPALFRLGVADYLVSPVGKDELLKSLKKVCQLNAAQEFALSVNDSEPADKRTRQYIAARTHRGVELIAMSDVYYFTADQKYVKVRHKGGIVLIDESLKDLETEFEGAMFRIHRNALINLDFLDLLETPEAGQHRVRFRGIDEVLAVSRRHLPALREKISKI